MSRAAARRAVAMTSADDAAIRGAASVRALVCEGPCSPATRAFDQARASLAADESYQATHKKYGELLDLGRWLVHTPHQFIGRGVRVSTGRPEPIEMYVCLQCGTERTW